MTIQEKYENKLLELIQNQVNNNENSLDNSDLQGVVNVMVRNLIGEIKGEEK